MVGLALQLGVAASFGKLPVAYFTNIPLGILSFVGLMFSATLLRHVILELRKSSQELAERSFELQQLRANLENLLIEQKASLDREVKQRLESHILAIRAELDQLEAASRSLSADAAGASAISDSLRDAIDNVVRPLSFEISNSVEVNLDALPTISQLRKRIRRQPFAIRLRSFVQLGFVFNIPLSALLLLIFVLPSYSFLFGSKGLLLLGLPAYLVSLGLIWLLNRATIRLRVPYPVAALAALVAGFLTAAPFVVIGALTMPEADQELIAYVTFAALLINVGTAFASLFIETAYLNLASADLENTETRKLVAYLQSQSQINRRSMAQVVHGRVQARLQAASIKLKQAQNITDELVREVTADLEGSMLDTTDTNFARQGVAEQLDEMAARWEGICDLSFVLEPGVVDVINANNIAKSSVVEIIREAVNNAVKHGEADEAEATISLVGRDVLRVEVRNAVYSSEPDQGDGQRRGYGSKMLDQITDDWSVEFADGDAILRATLKVTQ